MLSPAHLRQRAILYGVMALAGLIGWLAGIRKTNSLNLVEDSSMIPTYKMRGIVRHPRYVNAATAERHMWFEQSPSRAGVLICEVGTQNGVEIKGPICMFPSNEYDRRTIRDTDALLKAMVEGKLPRETRS